MQLNTLYTMSTHNEYLNSFPRGLIRNGRKNCVTQRDGKNKRNLKKKSIAGKVNRKGRKKQDLNLENWEKRGIKTADKNKEEHMIRTI